MKLLLHSYPKSLVAVLSLCLSFPHAGWAQPPQDTNNESASAGWTLEEATAHLRLYPKDVYVQYVEQQLKHRAGPAVSEKENVNQALRQMQTSAQRRRGQIDLFNLFSGALAVQESLQLETMLQVGNNQDLIQDSDETVSIADLEGPTIKSHSWSTMLAGRHPQMSPLAKNVPEDYYYVLFQSTSKLLDLLEAGDLWGAHLASQANQQAFTRSTGDRLKLQLAIETKNLLQSFYDLVIQEVAITGSDLYLSEGSDVTLLFRFRQPRVFRAQMDEFLDNTARQISGSAREESVYRDVPFVHLTSPNRRVHVYSAYPAEGIHVRSNSVVAFQRVLDTIVGKGKERPRSLGETEEFSYIRTLMPYGAELEDGLIYFSDPFIRKLVGPQIKLTESCRIRCYNHLRMIGHAAAMYETEYGHSAKSLEVLSESGCAPVFNGVDLTCPREGEYSLTTKGHVGECSYHGRADAMIPCCEIPQSIVSAKEAAVYQAFVTNYNRYWRTFFDPIAIRIQQSPEQYRIETIILPLIENSIYSSLSSTLGGEPKSLDVLPLPKRNIFSLAFQLDKERLLKESGWKPPQDKEEKPISSSRDKILDSINNLKQLGLAMHNYADRNRSDFPTVASFDDQGRPLLSWRVHLLPYLEREKLYAEFHLDEPWDSAHNKKLIARMPKVYLAPGRQKPRPGTTTYVVPVGPDTIFTGKERGMRFASIRDGSSNTMMLFEASEKHAVLWTKPEDIAQDPTEIRQALFGPYPDVGIAAFADASVRRLPRTLDDETLQAIITRNGGEVVRNVGLREPVRQRRRNNIFSMFAGRDSGFLDERQVYDFLTKGLSDSMGLHVYDADPMFDFQLAGFLGRMMGRFSGRQGSGISSNFVLPVFAIASLNSPVYVSVPLENTEVTDLFLKHFDEKVAVVVRKPQRSWFFSLDQDFYTFPLTTDIIARSAGIQFGPIKWRFFWARIGKTLYIASKSEVLEDLAAIVQEGQPVTKASIGEDPTRAHALLRIRPENWQEVLSTYQLGWVERYRKACNDNMGPLSSATRLANATNQPVGSIEELAETLYGVRYYCPEGGKYLYRGEHSASCSIHGSAATPHQTAIGQQDSQMNRLFNGFGGLMVTLTFLEDGLHAVLKVDRE